MTKTRKIVTAVIAVLCAILLVIGLTLLFVIGIPAAQFSSKVENVQLQPVSQSGEGGDRIHFMNTGSSDAILLESDGHFALIDAGEDTDNPRGFEALELEGFEDRVLAYLKEHAADENGQVYLDFVVGTHCHSDHLGGFDTIFADDAVTAGRAYLKVYDSSKIKEKEVEEWDNQEVYDQMVNALQARNIPIVSEPDGTPFTLGNFTITLFNTDDPETDEKVGENDQSLGVLVEKNGTRIFLAGDIDSYSGDEARLAPEIGDVDLLKVGHHSYVMSSTRKFIKTLSPETCVITNNYESLHKPVSAYIQYLCDPDFLLTGRENGIVAVIGDNGQIDYYNDIH